ncbi:DUF5133 domain-containing protein [Streptomyces sp. SLBN-118]|uniref:DUF5133 domain-containing protein n=1 Tax=Streptomyces sp. SLBN-118 TaxID=2768454 RepID=UPI0011520B0A
MLTPNESVTTEVLRTYRLQERRILRDPADLESRARFQDIAYTLWVLMGRRTPLEQPVSRKGTSLCYGPTRASRNDQRGHNSSARPQLSSRRGVLMNGRRRRSCGALALRCSRRSGSTARQWRPPTCGQANSTSQLAARTSGSSRSP